MNSLNANSDSNYPTQLNSISQQLFCLRRPALSELFAPVLRVVKEVSIYVVFYKDGVLGAIRNAIA